MKYIPNAMKSGTQSMSSSIILNMIFENCRSWAEIKNLGRFGFKIAMCSNFYEIWHLVQSKHASYEYNSRQILEGWHDYLLSIITCSE